MTDVDSKAPNGSNQAAGSSPAAGGSAALPKQAIIKNVDMSEEMQQM